jgi:hypothetical protein
VVVFFRPRAPKIKVDGACRGCCAQTRIACCQNTR